MLGRKASGGSREGQPAGIGETPRTSTESVGLTHLRHWPRGFSGGLLLPSSAPTGRPFCP